MSWSSGDFSLESNSYIVDQRCPVVISAPPEPYGFESTALAFCEEFTITDKSSVLYVNILAQAMGRGDRFQRESFDIDLPVSHHECMRIANKMLMNQYNFRSKYMVTVSASC